MLKYCGKAIAFQEIPDEITLLLEITNCPHHCKNCHSPYLREDTGWLLTDDTIKIMCEQEKFISCVCLMGGDSDHKDVIRIANLVHEAGLKMAFYSGDEDIDVNLIPYLDYYKVGPYDEKRGPLNKRKTNQKFYKIEKDKLKDITYRFWK